MGEMDELDQSKDERSYSTDVDDSRALMEAKATYMPSEGKNAIDQEGEDLDDK